MLYCWFPRPLAVNHCFISVHNSPISRKFWCVDTISQNLVQNLLTNLQMSGEIMLNLSEVVFKLHVGKTAILKQPYSNIRFSTVLMDVDIVG